MSRGIVTTAALAAAAAALAAAPAGAARTEVARMPSGQPQLAGDSVVFLSQVPGRIRLFRAAPGTSAPTPVHEFALAGPVDPFCCAQSYAVGFSASGTRVAASRFVELYAKGQLAESSFQLDVRSLGGESRRLFDCGGNHPYDLDGNRIAYFGDGCTEGSGSFRIVVRDLAADGAPAVATVPQSGSIATGLDLAGDHLLYTRFAGGQPQTVVRDLAAGADAYTLPSAGFPSLQADGKLAVARLDGDCRVEWYSRAEPTAHRLAVCAESGVAMHSDRIALVNRLARGAALEVVTLAGERRTVATVAGRLMVTGFDFDGSRVAYGVRGCARDNDAIYVDDLAGADPPPNETASCPVAISKRPRHASSKGVVRLPVSCREGCSGLLWLTRGDKLATRRQERFETGDPVLSASLRLANTVRRTLRQRGALTVQAHFRVDLRDGRVRTTSRALRLLAPRR